MHQVYGFNDACRFLISKGDLCGVVKDLGELRLWCVLIKNSAARSWVERLQETSISRKVLHEGGTAVWWRVKISIVANREHGLKTVADHAWHGDRQ